MCYNNTCLSHDKAVVQRTFLSAPFCSTKEEYNSTVLNCMWLRAMNMRLFAMQCCAETDKRARGAYCGDR